MQAHYQTKQELEHSRLLHLVAVRATLQYMHEVDELEIKLKALQS